jgi:hypothetical protein
MARIQHTITFSAAVYSQVFDLLDLFSTTLLSFGTPSDNHPATWSASFLIEDQDALNSLLALLPVDDYLPSDYNDANQKSKRPINDPSAKSTTQTYQSTKTTDANGNTVPF